MNKQNYLKREKKWKIYHKFEKKMRLTGQNGFNVLKELYRFAYNTNDMRNKSYMDMSRIKSLIHVHLTFNRLKS